MIYSWFQKNDWSGVLKGKHLCNLNTYFESNSFISNGKYGKFSLWNNWNAFSFFSDDDDERFALKNVLWIASFRTSVLLLRS